jgi:hypothetical protein
MADQRQAASIDSGHLAGFGVAVDGDAGSAEVVDQVDSLAAELQKIVAVDLRSTLVESLNRNHFEKPHRKGYASRLVERKNYTETRQDLLQSEKAQSDA